MTVPLILVAASGLAREAAAAAAGTREVLGFVDDDEAQWGKVLAGVPVLGGLDRLERHDNTEVLLCAGKGSSRAALVRRLAESGFDEARYATLIHPSVVVPDSCQVGAGSIVLAQTVLTTSVQIGRHCVVMPHVTLTHDNVLEDFVTIAAGVALGGWVHVGARSYVGMSASVRERIVIAQDVTLGMGSVVIRDVAAGRTMVGNPAHPLAAADI